MECSICYESFFKPKTNEELKKKINKLWNNKDFDLAKFDSLLITPNHNTTFKCSTNNCNNIICEVCWDKSSKLDDFISNIKPKNFTCPFCKQINYDKYYKKTVLIELKQKFFGDDFCVEYLKNILMFKL